MATGKKIISFSGSVGTKMVGDISSNNEYLAAEKIFGNAITLWNINTRKELRTLPALKSKITKVAFSECSTLVGVITIDKKIVLWEVATAKEIKQINKVSVTLEQALAAETKKTESPQRTK